MPTTPSRSRVIQLPVDDPGVPDTRSPVRLLVWVGRHQVPTLVAGVCFGIVWMVSQALMPFAIGQAIEDGDRRGDNRRSRAGRSSCSASARRRRSPG